MPATAGQAEGTGHQSSATRPSWDEAGVPWVPRARPLSLAGVSLGSWVPTAQRTVTRPSWTRRPGSALPSDPLRPRLGRTEMRPYGGKATGVTALACSRPLFPVMEAKTAPGRKFWKNPPYKLHLDVHPPETTAVVFWCVFCEVVFHAHTRPPRLGSRRALPSPKSLHTLGIFRGHCELSTVPSAQGQKQASRERSLCGLFRISHHHEEAVISLLMQDSGDACLSSGDAVLGAGAQGHGRGTACSA